MRRLSQVGFLAIVCVCVVSCSSKDSDRTEIEGTVKLDEQLVTSGIVTFHGKGDVRATGTIRPDGTYLISDAPVEVCQVTVENSPGSPVVVSNDQVAHNPEPIPIGMRIPGRYATPGNGLTCDVKPGKQVFGIELTTK